MTNRLIRYAAAIDFDGTIAETDFPNIIKPIPEALEFIAECKLHGVAVILNTLRTDEHLAIALGWCDIVGIKFDAVNENLQDWQDHFRQLYPEVEPDCRKIAADIYIDDRNAGGVNWGAAFEWLEMIGGCEDARG